MSDEVEDVDVRVEGDWASMDIEHGSPIIVLGHVRVR